MNSGKDSIQPIIVGKKGGGGKKEADNEGADKGS